MECEYAVTNIKLVSGYSTVVSSVYCLTSAYTIIHIYNMLGVQYERCFLKFVKNIEIMFFF